MNNNELKEESYLLYFSQEMLEKYGLTLEDKEMIVNFVERGIAERLYTNTDDFQHDLKHIEKVLTYVKMLTNRINNPQIRQDLLLTAALYHDIGKVMGASNKTHGVVGAQEFAKLSQENMSPKDIEIIKILIEQHDKEDDNIDFTDKDYSLEEQQAIQLMANILKDADALDRNRLNYPAPFGNCDVNKLRTVAAKEILSLTNSFYHDYYETIIKIREQRSGTKILNNYEKLEEWYANYENGKENMLHASLDASIDALKPRRSPQKGAYVYAGIDPTDCMKMATFRLSFLFDGHKENGMQILNETFPHTVDEALDGKFITFYLLPNELFHEYVRQVTASPNREWVSSSVVVPKEQISFEAKELVQYLIDTKRFAIRHNESQEVRMAAFVRMFRTYIWGIAEMEENPGIFEQKWQQLQSIVKCYETYCPNIMAKMTIIRQAIDDDIKNYIVDFQEKNGRKPTLSNEAEILKPVQSNFLGHYFAKLPNGKLDWHHLNMEYIEQILNKYGYSMDKSPEKVSSLLADKVKTRQESQKHFTTMNLEDKETFKTMQAINEKENNLEKSKDTLRKTLIKKENTGTNNSIDNGYISTLLLILSVGFIAGALVVLSYFFISRG